MLRRGGDPARSNIDALIGADGMVVRTVNAAGGQVRLQNGDVWTADSRPSPNRPMSPWASAYS